MGLISSACKWLLFVTNFLIFVLSCAALGLGIWILADRSSLIDLLDTVQTDTTVHIYNSTAVLILIVAFGSIIVSFFGCCGAYRESRCMVGTYFVLVFVLMVLGIAGSVVGMTQGVEKLSDPFLDTLSRYQLGRNGEIEQTWDTVQKDMQCCGVNSPADWNIYNSGFQNTEDRIVFVNVPESCCNQASDKQKCMASNTGTNGAFVEGCFTKARDQILVHTEAVGGVTLAIVIIMAINLILSLILCTCGFDNEDDARPKKGAYTQARQDRI